MLIQHRDFENIINLFLSPTEVHNQDTTLQGKKNKTEVMI